MSRRQAREAALQALFQLDLNPMTDSGAALEAVFHEIGHIAKKDCAYAYDLVNGTRENLVEIDGLISATSKDWKINRMAGVDKNITRIAIFEMRFSPGQIVPNIAINEAVELAKKFGSDDSARFVNGILGAMIK